MSIISCPMFDLSYCCTGQMKWWYIAYPGRGKKEEFVTYF